LINLSYLHENKSIMKYIQTVCILAFFTLIFSCKKEEQAGGVDKEMLDMAKATTGFTWYRLSDGWLPKSTGSGHNFSKLRTRFNAIAATMLDSTGKVKADANFPEGSFIVKELTNGSGAERYAMLLKRSGDASADSRGWIWGYVNGGGTVAEAASNKGSGCIGCHTQSGAIDYTLMNKFFP